MLKYFVLSLYLSCLTWQMFAEDEATFATELEEEDFGINEFNDTDGSEGPQARFVELNVSDKKYNFNFLPVNWHTAREYCTSENQVLASIDSPHETLQIMVSLLKHGVLDSNSSFWIGGSQLGHVGQWSWVKTGRPIQYNNWKDGEPIPYSNRHCLELLGNGKWNNNDCDVKRPVICQELPSRNSNYRMVEG